MRTLAFRASLLCSTVRVQLVRRLRTATDSAPGGGRRARGPNDASFVLHWHPGGFGGSVEIVATRGTVVRVP